MPRVYVTSDGKRFRTASKAKAHVRRVSDTKGYGLSIHVDDYDKPRRKNSGKNQKKTLKRISAALTGFLKRQNPSKMKGVTRVRVKKLKDGGITIRPAH